MGHSLVLRQMPSLYSTTSSVSTDFGEDFFSLRVVTNPIQHSSPQISVAHEEDGLLLKVSEMRFIRYWIEKGMQDPQDVERRAQEHIRKVG